MKYNKKILGIGVLSVLLTVGIAATASAYQGDYTVKGASYSPERHEAMTRALESKDYYAWKELMIGRGRVVDVITEDNFFKFADANRLASEGKYDEADALRKELGLRTKDGIKAGSGYGQGKDMKNRGNGIGMNR